VSSDIVERLRVMYVCDDHTYAELEEFALRNDAADIIERLQAERDAERALADKLASHLEWALRVVGSLPMELRVTFDNRMAEVLTAHKEARQ